MKTKIDTLRSGFSLIEMVIVILILGIIAAVAAPRFFDTARTAEENATRQQLAILRNAIEMYRASVGSYPGTDNLPEAMETMLNGPFPSPTLGELRDASGVHYDADSNLETDAVASPSDGVGWAYKPANGSLRLNITTGPGNDW